MTERTYRVGDVVAWLLVQDGWLVRVVGDVDSVELPAAYAIRHGDGGMWVYDPDEMGRATWTMAQVTWRWGSALNAGVLPPHGECTIIALDVPADATADDLRTLAERFEIHEHLIRTGDDSIWFGEDIDDLVPRLHRAGWRPGMTAEDAADLLAMPFTCCTCGKPITNSAELAACRGAGPVRAEAGR